MPFLPMSSHDAAPFRKPGANHLPGTFALRENGFMNYETRAQLETVVLKGSPTYKETAQALLSGELSWTENEIATFLDSYLNDPYLTRND